MPVGKLIDWMVKFEFDDDEVEEIGEIALVIDWAQPAPSTIDWQHGDWPRCGSSVPGSASQPMSTT